MFTRIKSRLAKKSGRQPTSRSWTEATNRRTTLMSDVRLWLQNTKEHPGYSTEITASIAGLRPGTQGGTSSTFTPLREWFGSSNYEPIRVVSNERLNAHAERRVLAMSSISATKHFVELMFSLLALYPFAVPQWRA